MSLTFPGESAEYRVARDRLLEREIELRREMEAVAAARRDLPPGGPIPEDYLFEGADADGAPTELRMSELFAPGKDSLVIYNFMTRRTSSSERKWSMRKIVGAGSSIRRTSLRCWAEARSVPNGFSIATASAEFKPVAASAGSAFVTRRVFGPGPATVRFGLSRSRRSIALDEKR